MIKTKKAGLAMPDFRGPTGVAGVKLAHAPAAFDGR